MPCQEATHKLFDELTDLPLPQAAVIIAQLVAALIHHHGRSAADEDKFAELVGEFLRQLRRSAGAAPGLQ